MASHQGLDCPSHPRPHEMDQAAILSFHGARNASYAWSDP